MNDVGIDTVCHGDLAIDAPNSAHCATACTVVIVIVST